MREPPLIKIHYDKSLYSGWVGLMPLVTGRGTHTHPVAYIFCETQNANLHR